MRPKESNATIVVAIIGLVGVLAAAVINNWSKLFPSPPTDVPRTELALPVVTNAPVPPCDGTSVEGFCWYLAGEHSPSCKEVCAAHSGYDEATRSYAGSDGLADNCQEVIAALHVSVTKVAAVRQGGLGCFVFQDLSGNYLGYWDRDPTTASATYQIIGRRRVCACNH